MAAIQTFEPAGTSKPVLPGPHNITVDGSGDLALLGGSDGNAAVYSVSQNKVVQGITVGNPVTDALWAGSRIIFATSAGSVKVFEADTEIVSISAHAGAVTALALHPSGEILSSVGIDKTFAFYDLSTTDKVLQKHTSSGRRYLIRWSQVFTDSHKALTTAQFHPDGHLFAAGGVDGQIKVFDVKSGANAANFDESGAIQALHFSENGTWLAAAVKGSTSVSIWDLRKSSQIKSLEMGGPVVALKWDYTGQFLAAAGPGGLTIQHYEKTSKGWSEPLRTALPAVAVDWGRKAQRLVTVSEAGAITVLGSA